MTQPDFRCERCGDDIDMVEVTMFGDPEPRYLPGKPCPCPGPRCPCCNRRLEDGRCPALVDCPVAGQRIPVPVIA